MAGDPDPVGDAESDCATHVNIAPVERQDGPWFRKEPVAVSIPIPEPVEEATPAPAEAAPAVSNMSMVTSSVDDVFKAAADGEAGTFELLKVTDPDKLKATNSSGFTVLHTAAWHDQRPVSDVLLSAGVDVNAKAKDGRTALHEAAIRNSLSVATALLAAKADVNATTDDGNTALNYSANHNEKPLTELLIANAADLNIQDRNGNTALHRCCYVCCNVCCVAAVLLCFTQGCMQ